MNVSLELILEAYSYLQCDMITTGGRPGARSTNDISIEFNQNLQCSGLKYTLPITTKFCTRHDSVTIVTGAKFRCDWLNIFQTRALHILLEFRIRSKYR